MTFPSDSTKPHAPHRYGYGDDYDSDAALPAWGQVDRPDKLLGYDFMDWGVPGSFDPDSTKLPAPHRFDRVAQILQRLQRHPPRKPSIRTLVKQAEKATGKAVTAITLPDGTKLDFEREQSSQGNEVDQWIAKHACALEGNS
jgi:hypothetical protein